MLSSLPSLPPLGAYDLYLSSLSPSPFSDTSTAGRPTTDPNDASPHQRSSQHPDAAGNGNATSSSSSSGGAPSRAFGRSMHAALRADENAILTRKANIRRFGAGWLKPPGVSKTLQGMEDERLEREEQEAAALREQALAEAQAAAAEAEAEAQAQAAGQGAEAVDGGEGDGDGDGERDLDDDIPDADAAGGGSQSDPGLEASSSPVARSSPGAEYEPDADWVDEPEGGFLPQDEGEGDYAEDGAAAAAVAMGRVGAVARDLDEDVPEAGEYEHTDTEEEEEEEEESSEDEGGRSGQALPVWARGGQFPEAARRSVGMADMELTSSMFGSSPVADEGDVAAARRRLRRSSGRRSGASAL